MIKVYVASPVRPVWEAEKACEAYALLRIHDYAMEGCLAVKKMGFLPVSPILAFDGIYDEFSERDAIDKACETLLLTCDLIYVVDTPYNGKSKGIARELEIAAQNGIDPLFQRERMSIEKEFLAYECGYENGLDDVVGEQQEREEEEAKKGILEDNIICPICGFYCLGNGGIGCIDKPSMYKVKDN